MSHLVEMHGGSVEAHSDGRGQGAVFTVRIRLADESQVAVVPERRRRAKRAVPVRLAGVRVLVVEDEADTRDLLAAALGHSGAEVGPAASAGRPWPPWSRRRPDVLVRDIGMPGEDGYALLERVRALAASRSAASCPPSP